MTSETRRPATPRGEQTRRRLFAAAETEFGCRGFHAASVSSITREAGVAQGTFYIYFASKEEILRELVRFMNRKLRHALTRATCGITDRVEAERVGLEAFLRFALEEKNLYRIVLESQFIDESIYREYYERMAQVYAVQLERAQEAGQVCPGSAYGQAWALMGMASFLGLRYPVWEGVMPPDEVLDAALAFIRGGLAPEPLAPPRSRPGDQWRLGTHRRS